MRTGQAHDIAAALGSPLVSTAVLAGGYSHETCLLTLADGPVVARFGGAAPAIEAAIMGLARAHVPVPEVLLLQPGVMVIEYVAGTLLTDALAGKDTGALGAEVGRVAAAIGHISFARPGFFTGPDLAPAPQPPWSRQLAGFAETCMARTPPERLDTATGRAWTRLCARHAPALEAVDGEARLAHGDLNPKNILVTRTGGGWRVNAVLDWEFGYAGCPAADAANMLRFGGDYPTAFRDGFAAAFGDSPDRAYAGRVLDMFALSDLATRGLDNPIADRAAAVIRRWVADGVPGPR